MTSPAILVVEDLDEHARLAELRLGPILRAERGIPPRFDRARTVAEAATLLRRHAYDLVLCDLHLPDSSDAETTFATVFGSARATPVVIYSADGEPARVFPFLRAGAADYLVKGSLDPAEWARVARLAVAARGAAREGVSPTAAVDFMFRSLGSLESGTDHLVRLVLEDNRRLGAIAVDVAENREALKALKDTVALREDIASVLAVVAAVKRTTRAVAYICGAIGTASGIAANWARVAEWFMP